ncbi:MAG: hypothetical protein RRY47_01970 [Oscillospiraceae bacterium]
MKKFIKHQLLAVILCVACLLSVGGGVLAADSKKPAETVYVTLDAQGATKEIIVKSKGLDKSLKTGELPFNIKLSYTFNDKETAPADILGKSGDVKILVDITPNDKAKAYYRENLALQMQFPLDTKDGGASEIVAPGLSGVTVGTVKTLGGIVLPGSSAKYEISYKTNSFEQLSVNFVCMSFDMSGIVDIDINTIKYQITQLQNGVSQYVNGVSQASAGLSQANAGIREIAANGAKLLEGYNQTVEGTNALISGLLAAMPPEQQAALAPQFEAIKAAQLQVSQSLGAYTGGVSQASAGLEQVTAGASALAKNGGAIKNGVNSASAPLNSMPNLSGTATPPQSFLSDDEVSEIQFVIKTDALAPEVAKADVDVTPKPNETFWDRLLALFGA